MPPLTLHARLDSLHLRVTARAWASRLTVLSRILLAAAFFPTGMVKLLGHRFSVMGIETPIGFFFEAMYRSGVYWRFLGLSQVVAALLLLLPRTAFIGALLFLPIIGNIAILTTALGFVGTPFITWLMFLANLWLIAWDWPRWRGLFAMHDERAIGREWSAAERYGWIICAMALMLVMLVTRGLAPTGVLIPAMAAGLLGGVTILAAWIRTSRRPSNDAAAPEPRAP